MFASPVAPTLTRLRVSGSRDFYGRAYHGWLPAPCSGYANHPNRAIDGEGTRTPQVRQPCWLLRSYTPPPLLVCLQPRLLKPSSAYARFYQAGPPRQPRRPPSALSPFAQLGCYLRWGDVIRLLGGRYPSVVAHTGSCATPVELSLPSAISLVPRVLAGCTQSLLLTAASRRYF